jgi:hypothetical protein
LVFYWCGTLCSNTKAFNETAKDLSALSARWEAEVMRRATKYYDAREYIGEGGEKK